MNLSESDRSYQNAPTEQKTDPDSNASVALDHAFSDTIINIENPTIIQGDLIPSLTRTGFVVGTVSEYKDPYIDFEEPSLVQAAQAGDSEAFSKIYSHYYPRVFRYTASRLRNDEVAADITQDAFFKILKNIGSFQYRGIPFGAWVFRIARNEVINELRRYKSQFTTTQLTENLADSADVENEVETDVLFELIAREIDSLPPQQRETVKKRFIEDLSVEETAQTLMKTENNVKVLSHKGIAKLRKMLASDSLPV